jgi:hypothetical protein
MPRQEGGHDQLAYERAQKQTDEAVDGGSKGQIELRRKAVEHRRGYLTTTSFILGYILGRNYRAQQIRAAFDQLIGGPQAVLAIDCGGEGFRIRRFDGAQLGEKAPVILTWRNAVEPLCRGLALRDFLVGTAYQLQQSGLVLAVTAGACIGTNASPNAAARRIEWSSQPARNIMPSRAAIW